MTTFLHRRALLRQWLSMLAVGTRLAQRAAAPKEGYLDLESPVVLQLEAITEPWSAVHFDAWLRRPDSTDRDVLLKGVLLRTATTDGPGELKAFCRLCPHEICNVEYVTDTAQVRLESGATPRHPLLVCPCHFSTFDPLADGAHISGPAFRGLYRFTTRVRRDTVEITQVEENVLALLARPVASSDEEW